MQRLIKFRAWDKDEGRMLYFRPLDNYLYYSDFKEGPSSSCAVSTYDFRGQLSEWMQYTGLKDKNGVEIYEGDIVRVENPDASVPMYDRYGTRFRVDYTYGMFVQNSANYCLHPGKHFAWGEIEVIGNIYENPELLEVH